MLLVRQGWKMESIKKLIHNTFDEESACNANLARLDKRNQRVIPGADLKHVSHNTSLDTSFIDHNLGKTRYERSREMV